MPLNQSEAAEALATIEATERRAKVLGAYRRGSPYLLLWGAIWIVGFSVTDLSLRYAGETWQALDAIGAIGTALLAARNCQQRISTASWRGIWRPLTMVALGVMFVYGALTLLHPRTLNAGLAFAGLLSGTVYAGVGVFLGARWLVTGLAMLALTFIGYVALPAHFALWMAWLGGGGLMLAGLWLRRV